MWEEVRPGRREGAGWRLVCTGRARLKAVGGQGRRRAHPEHDEHGRDLGRVEAERLVERRRALPSQKEYAWEGPTKRLFYNWEGPTQRLWWLRA